MKRVLFLDVDGVLNCQLLYQERHKRSKLTFNYWYWKIKSKIKWLLNGGKYKATSLLRPVAEQKRIDEKRSRFIYRFNRFKDQTCPMRLQWLNDFCEKMDCKIVVSSVWKNHFNIIEWNAVFIKMGFENIKVIGVTEGRRTLRGTEIKEWIDKYGCDDYVIVDDDSDMLPEQMPHFFLTDNYSGLTPTTLYLMTRYFNKESVNTLMPDELKKSIKDLLLFCEQDGTLINGFRTKGIILEIKKIAESY